MFLLSFLIISFLISLCTAVTHPKHCQNNILQIYIRSSHLRSSKGEGPELLQMFTGVRSLDTFISLHLFRLSTKDLLLLSTQLQRLTNPKKLSLKLALHGLFFLFVLEDWDGEGYTRVNIVCIFWIFFSSYSLQCIFLAVLLKRLWDTEKHVFIKLKYSSLLKKKNFSILVAF